jgi:peptidoglycan/LPS O-acetylase OafA/YrhL
VTDTAASAPPKGTRQRLEHIDAMRPVKQTAVISTHAWIFFAPVAVVGLAMVFRFARDAFLFVSAAMLTYSYRNEIKVHLRTYWRRRTASVVVPYVIWTVIYFFYHGSLLKLSFPFIAPHWHRLLSAHGLHHFLYLLFTGYFQLYFLLVILQFYVFFPMLLPWLKRHPEYHVRVLVAAAILQVLVSFFATAHFIAFPLGTYYSTRIVVFYPLYLIGGVVVALRLDQTHDWLLQNKRLVYVVTAASFVLLLGLYELQTHATTPRVLHTGQSVFSVFAIPYNTMMIACLYLVGVYLVDPKRSLRTKAIVQSGSDNSYGVYLSQMLWLPALVVVHRRFASDVPWLLMVLVALVVTYALGLLFTSVVARTPLAKPVVGRSRAPWRTLWPHRGLLGGTVSVDTGDGPMDVVVD